MIRHAAAVLSALALASCSSLNPFSEKLPPPPCPQTRVLADASDMTRFQEGAGRDVVDVLYGGRILDVIGACEHDIDKTTKAGSMTMELSPVVAVERGPADRSRVANFDYFVVLLDAQRRPVSRNVFTMKVQFEGNVTRIQHTDAPVTLNVPLKAGETGRSYEILVGFQLSKEDLEFNRTRGSALFR